MLKIRYFILIGFIFLAVAVFFTWEPLAAHFLGRFIKNNFEQQLGIQLDFEKIDQKNGRWTIHQPKFEGRLHGAANTIVLEFSNYFNDCNFSIDAGNLIVEGSTIAFRLNGSRDERGYLICQMSLHDTSQNGSVHLNYSRNHDKDLLIDAYLENFDCRCLNSFFDKNWRIDQGRLNGDISILLQKENFIGRGRIVAQELIGHLSNSNLKAFLPEVSFDLNSDHLSVNLMHAGHIQFQEGQKSIFEIKNIQGVCQLNTKGDFKGHLDAIFQNDKQSSVSIDATANIFKNSIDLKLNVENEEKQFVSAFLEISPLLNGEQTLNLKMEPFPFVPFEDNLVLIKSKIFQTPSTTKLEGCLLTSQDLVENSNTIFNLLFKNKNDPSTSSEGENWYSKTLALMGLSFLEGRFETHLSLDKCLPTWLNGIVQLNGSGYITGWFNEKSAVLNYQVENLKLHNKFCEIRLDSQRIPAVHYLDWKTGDQGVSVFIENATVSEKTKNFLMTDVSGHLTVGHGGVLLQDFAGFVFGIHARGDLGINVSRKDIDGFNFFADLNTLNGSVAQMQQLLECLEFPQILSKLPIDGNISLRDHSFFKYSFSPIAKTKSQEIDIHGQLLDGKLSRISSKELSLTDLSFNFDYNSNLESFEISDIQGLVLVGSKDKAEEYLLSGDYIRSNNNFDDLFFDVWVGEKNRDILRTAGHLKTLPENNVEFVFDNNKTHFGEMHLENLSFTLKNWTYLDKLTLDFNFKLDTLFEDLKRFSKTGFLFLSTHFLNELNKLKQASGQVFTKIIYNDENTQSSFEVIGKDFNIDKFSVNNFALKGTKRNQIWSIDQLHLDDISISSEFTYLSDIVKFNFLGVRCKDCLLAGLEGTFNPSQHKFEGKLNLLEADLESLKDWPLIKKNLPALWPAGYLKAKGSLALHWDENKHRVIPQANLVASLSDWKIGDFEFSNCNEIKLDFSNERGLNIQNLQSCLIHKKRPVAAFKVDFSLLNKTLLLDSLMFDVIEQNLAEIFELCNLPSVKVNNVGRLKGIARGSVSESQRKLFVNIPEGLFSFHNDIFDLQSCIFELLDSDLSFNAQCKSFIQPLDIHLKTNILAPETGFAEIKFGVDPELLMLNWKKFNNEISIYKVKGSLDGCEVNLERKESDDFEGEIALNISRSLPMIRHPFVDSFRQLGLDGKLRMSGLWNFENIAFKGHVEGDALQCKGWLLKKLYADVDYKNALVKIKNLSLPLSNGTLKADEANLYLKNSTTCLLDISKLQVMDFWLANGFMIKEMNLANVQGNLWDDSTVSATGDFSFENRSELALRMPSGINLEKGMDIKSLIPFTGTVIFQIDNRQMILQKLKDVSSQSHMSKFYLPKNPSKKSFIDFDGNVNIVVKMRQQHLLMKLAELFSFTVQGTIWEPIYSIVPAAK